MQKSASPATRTTFQRLPPQRRPRRTWSSLPLIHSLRMPRTYISSLLTAPPSLSCAALSWRPALPPPGAGPAGGHDPLTWPASGHDLSLPLVPAKRTIPIQTTTGNNGMSTIKRSPHRPRCLREKSRVLAHLHRER